MCPVALHGRAVFAHYSQCSEYPKRTWKEREEAQEGKARA